MHQFKINAKAAFDGEVWQWHQDYAHLVNDDDMPTPRAMNIAVFLDEVNEFNGPLMFIPGSHRQGRLEAGHDVTTTSYPLWTIDNDTITRLVDEGGIVAPKGPPGSMLMFHGNLVHASGSQPDAVVALDRLPVAQPLRQRDPPLQAARPGSPTATSRRSRCCPTTACSDLCARAARRGGLTEQRS